MWEPSHILQLRTRVGITMPRRRAILTDTERELIESGKRSDRYYQAVSRVRRKISEELSEDVELLEEHHPELLAELQGVVCENNS